MGAPTYPSFLLSSSAVALGALTTYWLQGDKLVPVPRPVDGAYHCVCEYESTAKDEGNHVFGWVLGLVVVQVTTLIGWLIRAALSYCQAARGQRRPQRQLALEQGSDSNNVGNAELARLQLEALRRR